MAKISIIIPVYNVENYLNRSLKTVTQQTFSDLEIVLIDDGSTDRSGELCDEWAKKDQRIRVLHQKNQGAGAARNHGLQVATGEYIGFVDSDDWIDIHMYEKLMDLLGRYPNAQIAMCGTQRTKGSDQEEIGKKKNAEVKVLDHDQMLRRFFREDGGESDFGIYTKLIRRDVLSEFHFVEGTISEDVMASYDFISHCDHMVMTSEKLYSYFDNRSGVTKSRASQKDFEYIRAFKKIACDIKKKEPGLFELAKVNYYRANFTILSKMKLYGFDREDEKLLLEYKKLKRIVRKHFREIWKIKMSFSRKLLLLYDCI